MNLTELREKMAALLKEAESLSVLARDGKLNAEQDARIDAVVTEINELGPQIDKAAQRATDLDKIDQLSAAYTKPAGTRVSGAIPAGGGGSGAPAAVDLRSIGRQFTTSPAFLDYQRKPHGKSEAVNFPRPFQRTMDDMLPADGKLGPEEARALIYNNPGNLVQPLRLPDIYAPLPRPRLIRDLLMNGRVTQNAIEFVQETTYTPLAAETLEATSVTVGAKPESALGFTVATTAVKTIATWIPITRQVIEDAVQLQSYVNMRLLQMVMEREDTELMLGDGVGANLLGILNQSGIQVLDETYFAANPLPAGSTNIDRIRRARTKVRVTGRARPDGIVIHPDDYEKFDEMKDSMGRYLLENPQADVDVMGPDRGENLWGLPIVESEAVVAGTACVGAFSTMAAVFEKDNLSVYIADQHSDFFIRNIFVLLAETRLALAVFRPVAFATVALNWA